MNPQTPPTSHHQWETSHTRRRRRKKQKVIKKESDVTETPNACKKKKARTLAFFGGKPCMKVKGKTNPNG